jgi:integrase
MAFSLATANMREAAERAKERYFFLTTNGWAAFLAKYRASNIANPATTTEAVKDLTVGQYLAAVIDSAELSKQTIESYAKPFRQIVAKIANIRGTSKRFNYRTGGHAEWIQKVHAVHLAEITPQKVIAWKKHAIARAGSDELLRKRYTVSINSLLRRARSLFSKRNVLSKLGDVVQLPEVLPFEGVSVEGRTDTKFYGCGVEAVDLFRDAVAELGKDHTEEFKAFLLALVLGLRRREADLLEWQSFDWSAGTLRIMPTKWYNLKTNESAALLPVEPEIMALFRGWYASDKEPNGFVIKSARKPKSVRYQWYRCGPLFDALLVWLRAKGVQGQKPFHTLRKLYGSAMADKHGLHAASSGLRHSDIRTTSEFYADRTVKLTPGFGSALSGASVSPLPTPVAPHTAAHRDQTGRAK